LLQEAKEDKNKWEEFLVHGLKDLILLKYLYYPMIYRFTGIPTKIPTLFFAEIEKKS